MFVAARRETTAVLVGSFFPNKLEKSLSSPREASLAPAANEETWWHTALRAAADNGRCWTNWRVRRRREQFARLKGTRHFFAIDPLTFSRLVHDSRRNTVHSVSVIQSATKKQPVNFVKLMNEHGNMHILTCTLRLLFIWRMRWWRHVNIAS